MSLEPLKVKIKLAGNPANDPQFSVLASLSTGEKLNLSDPKAVRAMVALMDMQAVLGGAASHWGGPSAFAELMSAVHGYVFFSAQKNKQPWYEMFQIVNDAGHCENGLYALKANYGYADLTINDLKGFRSIESGLTGHGEAHLFPQGVYISNGPLGSGLPQAQGLAMADALKKSTRTTITAISDGGCMEGEAKESLVAIPGLAQKGRLGRFLMVISDNNTKLSGRIDDESFSMQPTFTSLSTLGWKVFVLEEAHDLTKCLHCLEEALAWLQKHPEQPVAIHAKTIKGYGVKKTAESSSGGHGFPLKSAEELPAFLREIYHGDKVPDEFMSWTSELIDLEKQKKSVAKVESAVPNEKVQVGISQALIKLRKSGLPIVSVSADLPGSTGVAEFRKEFPEASFDVGVAEANMISVGIGLSKEGFIPVVDTFSQFGVTKGGLPLIMSALSQGPVIGIFSHAGFQDAADGASHQALSYFAMTHSIPYTDTYCLTCSDEAEMLLEQAVKKFADDRKQGKTPRTSLFFLGRENFPRHYSPIDSSYTLGKAQVVFDTSKNFEQSAVVVAAGPLLKQALMAAKALEEQGVGLIVINPSIINRPDIKTIATELQKVNGYLLTVEDHQLVGGMGSVLAHELALAGVKFKIKSLGVKGEFGQSSYTADELYQKHELDAKAIACAVRSWF